jgi:hypothetical protein
MRWSHLVTCIPEVLLAPISALVAGHWPEDCPNKPRAALVGTFSVHIIATGSSPRADPATPVKSTPPRPQAIQADAWGSNPSNQQGVPKASSTGEDRWWVREHCMRTMCERAWVCVVNLTGREFSPWPKAHGMAHTLPCACLDAVSIIHQQRAWPWLHLHVHKHYSPTPLHRSPDVANQVALTHTCTLPPFKVCPYQDASPSAAMTACTCCLQVQRQLRQLHAQQRYLHPPPQLLISLPAPLLPLCSSSSLLQCPPLSDSCSGAWYRL